MREGNSFSLFVSQHPGSTPSPSYNTSTGAMSFPGSTPSPYHNTFTGPMSFPGGTPWYPHPVMGTKSGQGVPQHGIPLSWDGIPPQPGQTQPSQVGSTLSQGTPSPSRMLYLPHRESTCYAAGGMPLSFTQEDFLVIPRIGGPIFLTKCWQPIKSHFYF